MQNVEILETEEANAVNHNIVFGNDLRLSSFRLIDLDATGAGGTALTHTDTFTGNSGTKAYTINDVVKHLKTIGILAAS